MKKMSKTVLVNPMLDGMVSRRGGAGVKVTANHRPTSVEELPGAISSKTLLKMKVIYKNKLVINAKKNNRRRNRDNRELLLKETTDRVQNS